MLVPSALALAVLGLSPQVQPQALQLRSYHLRTVCPPQLLAPSGIDELPNALQAATFAAIFAGLGVASLSSASVYEAARSRSASRRAWDTWESFSAVVLGLTFVAAGRSHFTLPEAFKAIYPPPGTWGFWYLPGSADFHVAWTGVAECLGGAGLLLGCLLRLAAPQQQQLLLPWAARAVLLLVVCVTPANIFMFTHGATMPSLMDGDLPLGWHAGRAVAQAIVLSVLLTLSAVPVGPATRSEAEPDL